MPSLSPAYPAFSLFFCPLSPRPPSPAGKGGAQGYFMQGAAPLASPGLNLRFAAKPTEFLYLERCRKPRRGGTGGEELRRLRWSSPPGLGEQVPPGACLPCRPLPLPLACFSAPIPPTPFPSGEGGGFKVYFAGGYRPRHPCNRVGCGTGFSCGKRCPEGGFAPCIPGAEPTVRRKNGRKRFPMGGAGSQGEGGPGEMELSVARDGGV